MPLLLCYVIKDRASLLNAAAIKGSERDTHVGLRSSNCGFHELCDHHSTTTIRSNIFYLRQFKFLYESSNFDVWHKRMLIYFLLIPNLLYISLTNLQKIDIQKIKF